MPAEFTRLYGRPPGVVASAPGRVNLMGEHIDYNGGLVLPMPIPQRMRGSIAARSDTRVEAWSREIDAGGPEQYVLGGEKPGRGWIDYVQGVTAALFEAGHAIGGFDLTLESDVPAGAGLASSAALEVALLRALRALFGLTLDDVGLALLAQRAENDFVGAPVGIMDPLAASLAEPGEALLIDTRTLAAERISLPESIEPIVIASGIAHSHASGGYRTRRAECERAAATLGVAALSDLDEADLARAHALPDPLVRRVRHVITENARVRATVAALRGEDADALGRLFAASHASMRDDYEVSLPEIDRLVAIAAADRDVVAARLTGGGFGGSIVALARAGCALDAANRIVTAYGEGRVLVPDGSRCRETAS